MYKNRTKQKKTSVIVRSCLKHCRGDRERESEIIMRRKLQCNGYLCSILYIIHLRDKEDTLAVSPSPSIVTQNKIKIKIIKRIINKYENLHIFYTKLKVLSGWIFSFNFPISRPPVPSPPPSL